VVTEEVAMRGVNKVILLGNVGKDPEVRYTQSGDAVCNFSLATNEKWKTRDGETKEATEWHRCTAWKRLAEVCGEYLHKGDPVYVEGAIKTKKWQGQDGADRYTTEIHVLTMQMLGSRKDRGGDTHGNQQGGQQRGGQDVSTQFDDDEIPY